MKKTLISLLALTVSLPVLAAGDCSYSILQNLIRNVRSVDEVNMLIQQGVQFDEQVSCGGSLIQLAILRGNPAVLNAILNQDKSRANSRVSLDLNNSSRQVPLILFASYYAPNADMVNELLKADPSIIAEKDESGRNLLWYMEQNPVLRNTPLYDNLKQLLIRALIPTRQNFQFSGTQQAPAQQGQQGIVPGQNMPQTQRQPLGPSVVEANN